MRVVDDLGQDSPRLPPEGPRVPGHEVIGVPERVGTLRLGEHRRAGGDRCSPGYGKPMVPISIMVFSG